MLGFSSYSELPIAAAVTSLAATAYMGGVSATTAAGVAEYDAKANITTAATAATFTAAPFTDVDAKANITTTSVTATTANTFGGIANTTTLTPVTATTVNNVFDDVDAQATITPSAATATFTAGTLDYDAKAVTPALTGVQLNINNYELADEDAQATATVSGVSATTTADWDTVNGIYAVQVIFTNTDFERTRTINIVPYGNYKVYITR